MQATIDAEVRKYQSILDKIDIEIQMSKRVIDAALAERQKRLKESQNGSAQETKVKEEPSEAKNDSSDDIEEIKRPEDISGFNDLAPADSFGDGLDLIMKAVGDDNNGGDDLNSLFTDSFDMMMPN